jgi:hypothetical protein
MIRHGGSYGHQGGLVAAVPGMQHGRVGMRAPTCPLKERTWPSLVAVVVSAAPHPSIVCASGQRRRAGNSIGEGRIWS